MQRNVVKIGLLTGLGLTYGLGPAASASASWRPRSRH